MANSRTPKRKLRPAGVAAWKSGDPAISVLLEGARSAEPPTRPGSRGARALMTLPEAGAGGERLAHLEALHRPHFHPPRREVLLPAGGGLRVGGEAAVAALLPGLPGRGPAGHALAEEGVDRRVHLEAALHRPAHGLLGPGDLLLAQRRPVGVGGVLLGRRPEGDVGAAGDQRRPGLVGQGGGDGRRHRGAVVAVGRQSLPAESGEAGGHVLGEGQAGRALDGDAGCRRRGR